MKTEKMTINDLFQVQKRYVVPLFQRGYVWAETAQWRPLWDDVAEEAGVLARNRVNPQSRVQRHFLGAVVVNVTQPSIQRVPVVEIIDGQQRLTTIQILLTALRDATRGIADQFSMAALEMLTRNRPPLALEEEAYKVWPTGSMQEHLRRVFDSGSAEALEAHYALTHRFRYGRWQPPRPRVVEAYLFFSKRVGEFLDDEFDELPLDLVPLTKEDRIALFTDALVRHVQLVAIELDQEDDAQVIFESLNARGEPLQASDLVRNFVFLAATRSNLSVESLYDELWREFEEVPQERPFWRQTERQGRLLRSRMDLFLFHYMTFRIAEEFKVEHLYQVFRDWWDAQSGRDIRKELEELHRFAVVYRELLEPMGTGRFAKFAKRLRALDTTAAYPLVLWASDRLATNSTEFEGILDDIESYFVRRAVCGYGTKSYTRNTVEWLAKLKQAPAGQARAALQALLSSSSADSQAWPADSEFQDDIVSEPMYGVQLRPKVVSMILEALDEGSRAQFMEHIVITTPLTVEHLRPQSAAEESWPLEPHEMGSEESQRVRSRLTQTFGNLTLLTQPLNSSISNGPFAAKQEAIAQQALLPMNVYFQNRMSWNNADILERGRHLAKVAASVWPRPATVEDARNTQPPDNDRST